MGKAFPNPWKHGFRALPMMLDGAERSLMGQSAGALTSLQIQGYTTPPPPSCISIGGPLPWDTVLAA